MLRIITREKRLGRLIRSRGAEVPPLVCAPGGNYPSAPAYGLATVATWTVWRPWQVAGLTVSNYDNRCIVTSPPHGKQHS